MDTSSTDQPADSGSTAPESLNNLLGHIETLLPASKETSVSTVVLYLDNDGDERLIITGLRYPSGNIGQIRFDYRAPESSKLIDLDMTAMTMQSYDMDQGPESSPVSRHSLNVAETSSWLDGLIGRGSVERV